MYVDADQNSVEDDEWSRAGVLGNGEGRGVEKGNSK